MVKGQDWTYELTTKKEPGSINYIQNIKKSVILNVLNYIFNSFNNNNNS